MSKLNSIIGLRELRENTEKYITAVERGRSFTVARRSRPIFKLVPVDEWGDEGKWETLLDLSNEPGGGIEAGKLLKMFKKFDTKQSRKISKKVRS